MPTKPRGSLLFMGGRGDAYEKYFETLDYWHRRGWAVTALDWRGQAGSGRLGADDETGHIDDFLTWVSDLATFWEQWGDPALGPRVIVAHSMGAHLVLRALAARRIDPAAAVLCAPMLGFASRGLPAWLLHGAARLMCRIGDPRRPAWKYSTKPDHRLSGHGLALTHDPERSADRLWWRTQRPETAMGPGSWGWVERSYASMRELGRPGALEKIVTPLLIIATAADQLVAIAPVERAARRLPHAEFLRFEDAGHEILRETDSIRDRALAAIDEFFDRQAAA